MIAFWWLFFISVSKVSKYDIFSLDASMSSFVDPEKHFLRKIHSGMCEVPVSPYWELYLSVQNSRRFLKLLVLPPRGFDLYCSADWTD